MDETLTTPGNVHRLKSVVLVPEQFTPRGWRREGRRA